MTEQAVTGRTRDVVIFLDRLILSFTRHWLLILSLILGVWVLLPWLAPVLMAAGWERGARLIYTFYSTQCHQLPQRSYFLFGPRLMVPLADINAAWPYTDYLRLRQFIGTPEMGYKVAWSDRMVSLYTPLFVGALLFALARQRLRKERPWRPLSVQWWLLALVPIFLDSVTHMIGEALHPIYGFRDSNAWLARLTGDAFAPTFYAGDAIGSFNWWMRLLTGLLAGFATVWLVYPHVAQALAEMRETLEARLERARARDASQRQAAGHSTLGERTKAEQR
jgi:uncharacterized membrane protein